MMQTWSERWNRIWGGRLARGGWAILLIFSALLAVAAILYVTEAGPGTSGDSVHYLQGAQNLLDGKGYSRLKGDGSTVPQTAFPPMFSLVLAGLGWFMPVFDAARLLNALLLGASVIVIGLLTFQLTRSGIYALLAGWLLMYAEDVFRIHAWAMSEPLFIFLTLLVCYLCNEYFNTRRWPFLIAVGLTASAAALTRYAGLALLPALGLLVLFSGRLKWMQRVGHAAIFSTAALLPLLIWFGRNSLVAGSASNRVLGYHPMSKELISHFTDQISRYWLPAWFTWPWKVRLGLTLLWMLASMMIYLAVWYRQQKSASQNPVNPMPGFLAVYVFFYIVLLLINTTFLDASTDEPGIRRYALPLLPVFILGAFASFPLLATCFDRKRWIKVAITFVGLLLVLYYARESVSYLRHPNYSFGYTDIRHAWECEVNTLHSLPSDIPLLTSDYELFYFLADRPAYALPRRYDHYQAKEVADYAEKRAEMRQFLAQGGILVVFGIPDEYPDEINGLLADEHLETKYECSKARFYYLPQE